MENEIIRFGTQIIKYSVDDNLINKLLESSKKQTIPYNELLVANIEKELGFDVEDKKYFYPKILPFLKNYIEKFISPNEPDIDFDIEIRDMWVNFQKAGEYNPPHIHPGHLSFVLYLQMPEEIKSEKNIAFSKPHGSISFTHLEYPKIRGVLSNIELQIDNAVLPKWFYNHLPNTGDMFVFPSYINHFVESFDTPNVERISVAGNAFLKGKYKKTSLI